MKQSSVLLIVIFAFLPMFAVAQLSDLDNKLLVSSPVGIAADADLSAYVITKAELAIDEHCASCHGPNLEGKIGVPNLVDYDWLWGVTGYESTTIEPTLAIMQTILHGIRDTNCPEESKRYGACPDTRFSQMPSYEDIGLTGQQINDITEYVINMSRSEIEADAEAVARAEDLWPICTECHGDNGWGYKPYGGPDLSDNIWLFGGSRDQIHNVIAKGRTEYCPAWSETLDAVTIKALAVYIYNKANGF